ncbi:MAG: hypothetical protein M5U34_20295 [Chloroflexi bacterium]|nr:hypothetical protein [Chloroflexota bacterium]
MAEGALEFNIKGSQGGEDFTIALRDRVMARNPAETASAEVTLSSVLPVTDEWQHVRIPLRSFIAESATFDPQQMFTINFAGVDSGEKELLAQRH